MHHTYIYQRSLPHSYPLWEVEILDPEAPSQSGARNWMIVIVNSGATR